MKKRTYTKSKVCKYAACKKEFIPTAAHDLFCSDACRIAQMKIRTCTSQIRTSVDKLIDLKVISNISELGNVI